MATQKITVGATPVQIAPAGAAVTASWRGTHYVNFATTDDDVAPDPATAIAHLLKPGQQITRQGITGTGVLWAWREGQGGDVDLAVDL